MASAAEQQADDFSDEGFAPNKEQTLKLGFLKVGIFNLIYQSLACKKDALLR